MICGRQILLQRHPAGRRRQEFLGGEHGFLLLGQLLVFKMLPVLPGRAAELPPEPLVKIFDVREAAGNADVQERKVRQKEKLAGFFASHFHHIGLKGHTEDRLEKVGQVAHGQSQLLRQVREEQLLGVVAVYVAADLPDPPGSGGGELPLLFRDADAGKIPGQSLEKETDQSRAAEGGIVPGMEVGAGNVKEHPCQRSPYIRSPCIRNQHVRILRIPGVRLQGELYIFYLGKDRPEKGGGDLQGQDQGGLLCDQLVAGKGVNDPEAALLIGVLPPPGQQAHRPLQEQTDLKILMYMGRPVEEIDHENLVLAGPVGNHFKFIFHLLSTSLPVYRNHRRRANKKANLS